MNETIRLMQSHRSIRKYAQNQVEASKLNRILKASICASSSGNMQAYSIIITKDPRLKKRLHNAHMKQSMTIEAPILVTFCADFNRTRKWLHASQAKDQFDNFMSFMIAAIDAILVSQNFVLAAESEGLGICYMGSTLANCHQISKILKCPKNVVPVVGFSLGYPAEKPNVRKRLPLTSLVHTDVYKDYSKNRIKNIYKEREILGMKRYKSIPELKKLIDESKVKNLAQVYSQIKYTKESHIQYSKNIFETLRRAEFL